MNSDIALRWGCRLFVSRFRGVGTLEAAILGVVWEIWQYRIVGLGELSCPETLNAEVSRGPLYWSQFLKRVTK